MRSSAVTAGWWALALACYIAGVFFAARRLGHEPA
jgi:hypothetical protein